MALLCLKDDIIYIYCTVQSTLLVSARLKMMMMPFKGPLVRAGKSGMLKAAPSGGGELLLSVTGKDSTSQRVFLKSRDSLFFFQGENELLQLLTCYETATTMY